MEEEELCGDESKAIFPFAYLSKYFELFGPQNKDNMSVKCKLCSGASKILKSAWSTASNLRKHITRIHPSKVVEMEQLQQQAKKRKTSSEIDNTTERKKQQTLSFTPNTASQNTVDRLVVEFVCNSVQPFSVVEEESFIKLVKGLAPNRTVMCRKTVAVRIREQYGSLRKRLMTELAKVRAVSTTTDGWTHFSRAYLGITVHWVDSDTLERKSAMLTVERLVGRHTYDVLAAAIERVHQDYNIQNKVVSCVTDNGSNFVKAFTMFGIKAEPQIEFVEVSSILDEGENELDHTLPPHQRYAAHTLNLVAVKDSHKAEEDGGFKKIARSSFARCQALWNKQRSTVVADSIQSTFQRLLITPNVTRWNSVYESVKCLVAETKRCGPSAVDGLMDQIGLPRFRAAELTFLREYILVMKPVAVALNIMQAEKNMYIGYLLPTIKCLLRELNAKVNDAALMYCRPLAKALVEGVQKRFASSMTNKKLIVAAGLVPALKFSWMEGQEKEEAISMLKEEVLSTCEMVKTLGAMETKAGEFSDEEESFFRSATEPVASPELDEVISYLSSSSRDIKLILQYPSLLGIFMKLNTGIPSSAPVERLFSKCKDVLSSKRSRLSDENFKHQLFCKVNGKLFV